MDEIRETRPVPGWYMPAAVASLLFMALGCAMYVLSVTTDPAMLPADQRAAYEAQPTWIVAANAVAVWVGVVGTVLLVLKRRLAEPLLLVSLLAVLAWLGGLLLVPALRDALTSNDIAVALAVAVITWTIYWFARGSRQKGWLR